MLSVSPCRTRTTVPSMRPAAVICRSRSASCPELAGALLREGVRAGIWRGDSPSRSRAWSGMSRPSAMRSKTLASRILRMPLMISLIRPWPRPTAVAMRIWLSPVYWHSSRNRAPMSRLRKARGRRRGVPRRRGVSPEGRMRLDAWRSFDLCRAPAPV